MTKLWHFYSDDELLTTYVHELQLLFFALTGTNLI